MNGHTSQRQADELARSLEPGQMARLTRGIWLRRSLDGRHRYVVSVRGAGRGARVHHATHDTLLAALDDRDMAVGRRAQERRAAGGRPRAGSNPGMETLSTHLRRDPSTATMTQINEGRGSRLWRGVQCAFRQ
jgi:hypothetical protein